jgi:cytoskeletal protein CcmA (bactofilin family)
MPDVNVTLTRPTPPAPAPAPPSLAAALGDQGETLVGRDSSVEGTIRSDHSIRIQGSAQGEIESKGSVVVEEGARVNAKVTAAEIVVSGELNGQVYSSGRVEIRPRGTLTGEIHAPSLVIHEDAIFEGQVQMKGRGGPGDSGDREATGGVPGRRMPSAGTTPQGRAAPPAE